MRLGKPEVFSVQVNPRNRFINRIAFLLPVAKLLQPVEHSVVLPRDDVTLFPFVLVDVSGLVGIDVEPRHRLPGADIDATMKDAAQVGAFSAAYG